jgi:two-component system chemotaxis response regulator CheB
MKVCDVATIDTVVLGASSAGIKSLEKLLSLLPVSFPASISIVMCGPRSAVQALPKILNSKSRLIATLAEDGETTANGHVYVAPYACDMFLHISSISVQSFLLSETNDRPIDRLFFSATRNRGWRTIGVLLTDIFEDGAIGLSAIRGRGGSAIVQDPAEAVFSDMPSRAVATQVPHLVLPISSIAKALIRLAGTTEAEGVVQKRKAVLKMTERLGNEISRSTDGGCC